MNSRLHPRHVPTTLPVLLGLGLFAFHAGASDWPQWRGPRRDGISAEQGLLQSWPQGGPKLAWKIPDAGSGYASPAVVGDRIYLIGSDGMENESVRAFSAKDGKALWSTRLGKVGPNDQRMNFAGSRSTPAVAGEFLYALGSDGDLACLETATGKVRWQKNLRTDFGGKPGAWAYSESPLVDGNAVVCTPGGSDATMVALDRVSGAVLWKCALPEGDEAAYASVVIVETGGVKQYVQLLQKGLVGVEASSGKFLWRYGKAVSKYGANIPTPVASDGRIYVGVAGTGGGAIALKAKDGQVSVEPLYFESKLPTSIGGTVKIGNYLYGTTGQAMVCIDFLTGAVKWEERAIGPASLVYAEGRLFLHGENGEVALVDPSPEGYREKGRFAPEDRPRKTRPMEKSWAYPALANGKLYLRDQGMLWCYDVR